MGLLQKMDGSRRTGMAHDACEPFEPLAGCSPPNQERKPG